MTGMYPFGHFTVCPKDKGRKVKRIYHAPSVIVDTNKDEWQMPEHLVCVCATCGYSWQEFCADDAIKTGKLDESMLPKEVSA